MEDNIESIKDSPTNKEDPISSNIGKFLVLVDVLVDICLYIPLTIPDVPVSAVKTRK